MERIYPNWSFHQEGCIDSECAGCWGGFDWNNLSSVQDGYMSAERDGVTTIVTYSAYGDVAVTSDPAALDDPDDPPYTNPPTPENTTTAPYTGFDSGIVELDETDYADLDPDTALPDLMERIADGLRDWRTAKREIDK